MVQAVGSSFSRVATTNAQGEFRIDGLLPGSYRVIVTASGFAQATANVDVAVSDVRDIDVTLNPQGARETVNVQGSPSSITTATVNTASAVRGGVVGSQDLETFPLPARSFANIAYLVPGTEPVEPSDPTKARITAVSTGGSSGLNNELSVDGADNSDDWIGGFLQNFSPDGIQEFAVRTSNEDADTGWTTAGSVVITTKRGTNDWHGDAAFYERAAALNARFPIENPAETCTDGTCVHNPKQPFSRQNYVGTLGGPIVRRTRSGSSPRSRTSTRTPASPTAPPACSSSTRSARSPPQGLIPGVASIAVPSTVPIPFRDYLGSVRFDWAAVAQVAVVSAHLRGLLPHPQRARRAGHSSFHRIAHAQQLLERGPQQLLHVQPHLARQPRPRLPACCTSPRRATPISASRWLSPSAPRRSPSPDSKPSATTSSPPPSRSFPTCAIRISTRRATT